jgi:tripeptide aminopeptidase
MSRQSSPSAMDLLAAVAKHRDTHHAFQYLHLRETQFQRWHEAVVQIPAPPFGEADRSRWLSDRFLELGLSNVETDAEGNTLGTLPGRSNKHSAGDATVMVSAHLDTVFPADTPLGIRYEGNKLCTPGAADNCAGLVALLAVAAALKSAKVCPSATILFVGTVGEEGEGNLRGMRALFPSPRTRSVRACIVLDGAGTTHAVSHALGSRRYEVTVSGPGGHAWTDSQRPNPIVVLGQAMAAFAAKPIPEEPRTSVNFGTIAGGTSVNAIPESVTARVDIRSEDFEEIIRQEVRLHRTVEDAVLAARQDARIRLRHRIVIIGERPSGQLPESSCLAHAMRAVDRHLQLRTRWRIASTDANIPLAMGIAAIAVGGGGSGGGAHTLEEWYDPAGRELALRRILLLLLTVSEQLAVGAAEEPAR